MAKELPPYVNATGIIKKVFDKVKESSTKYASMSVTNMSLLYR